MRTSCQYCAEATDVRVPRTGGIFRCPSCMKLNLLLQQNAAGQLQFGNFVVLEEVGQGANAVVCKAQYSLNRQVYALKLFLSDRHAEEHATREFIRESGIAKEIVHKNIVRMYECGELNHIRHLVLEFVDGLNMAQYLERYGKMDPFDALSLGSYVCAALDHVWSNFLMVHRDIKPQNIMLDHQGQVKVCDFGMVTAHELSLVDLNAVEGTPYYLSPESITEDAYQDNRTDIYSLGATLYHIISGSPPFNYGSVMEVVDARLKEPPPDLRDIAPEVSDETAAVILTMMSVQPDERYDTATQCLEDMQRVRRGEPPLLVDPNREKSNE